jgi:hypothetical protein
VKDFSVTSYDESIDLKLPLPDFEVETPCFVVLEPVIEHNLQQTAALAVSVADEIPR